MQHGALNQERPGAGTLVFDENQAAALVCGLPRDRRWSVRAWTASWMLVGTQLPSGREPGPHVSTHGTRNFRSCRSRRQARMCANSSIHSGGAVTTMGPADMFLCIRSLTPRTVPRSRPSPAVRTCEMGPVGHTASAGAARDSVGR